MAGSSAKARVRGVLRDPGVTQAWETPSEARARTRRTVNWKLRSATGFHLTAPALGATLEGGSHRDEGPGQQVEAGRHLQGTDEHGPGGLPGDRPHHPDRP